MAGAAGDLRGSARIGSNLPKEAREAAGSPGGALGAKAAKTREDTKKRKWRNETQGARRASKTRGRPGLREPLGARRWLESPKLATSPVRIVCEVQCLLRSHRDMRLQMHELYKVLRAENDLALYLDFEKLGRLEEKRRSHERAGDTVLKRVARDGSLEKMNEELMRLADPLGKFTELKNVQPVDGEDYASLYQSVLVDLPVGVYFHKFLNEVTAGAA